MTRVSLIVTIILAALALIAFIGGGPAVLLGLAAGIWALVTGLSLLD